MSAARGTPSKDIDGIVVGHREIYDRVMEIHTEVVGGNHRGRLRRLEAAVVFILISGAGALGDAIVPGGLI